MNSSDKPLQNNTVETNSTKSVTHSPIQSVPLRSLEVVTIDNKRSSPLSSVNVTLYTKSRVGNSTRRRYIEELKARKMVLGYKQPLTCLHCFLFKENNLSLFSLHTDGQSYRRHKQMDVTVISVLSLLFYLLLYD